MPEQKASGDEDKKAANMRLKPKKSQVSEENELAKQLAESLGGQLINEFAGSLTKAVLPLVSNVIKAAPKTASTARQIFRTQLNTKNSVTTAKRILDTAKSRKSIQGMFELPSAVKTPKLKIVKPNKPFGKPKAATEVPTIEPKPIPKSPKTTEPITTPKPKTAPETTPKPQTTPKDLPVGIDIDTGILKKIKPVGSKVAVPAAISAKLSEPKPETQSQKDSKRNRIRNAIGTGTGTRASSSGGGGSNLPGGNIPSLQGPRQSGGNIYQAISL